MGRESLFAPAMNDTLSTALAYIPALVIAIVFHEVAHGFVAKLLGDPTASEEKRLSLNPLRHVDPIGTVLLPGMLALTGAPVFGWAKPVPVNKWRLRNPRFGMMAVAAAGPLTNLVLAGIGAVVLGVMARSVHGPVTGGGLEFAFTGVQFFILVNIFLALFNLLPIPPFDGSHVLEGILPRRAAELYNRLRPFGFVLVFGLLLILPIVFPEAKVIQRLIGPPAEWLATHYMLLAGAIAGN